MRWARAVEWAVENLHRTKVDPKKVGAMRYAIWEYGRENAKDLNVQMMPRALAIIDKHEAVKTDAGAEVEEKAVEEIDKMLKAAIEEAKV